MGRAMPPVWYANRCAVAFILACLAQRWIFRLADMMYLPSTIYNSQADIFVPNLELLNAKYKISCFMYDQTEVVRGR